MNQFEISLYQIESGKIKSLVDSPIYYPKNCWDFFPEYFEMKLNTIEKYEQSSFSSKFLFNSLKEFLTCNHIKVFIDDCHEKLWMFDKDEEGKWYLSASQI